MMNLVSAVPTTIGSCINHFEYSILHDKTHFKKPVKWVIVLGVC